LRHNDSMGHTQVIKHGDVQVMSAGTGVSHSEYNDSDSEIVNFLQIWVLPKRQNIEPRYDQKTFQLSERQDRFQVIASPEADSSSLWINQDAWFSLGYFQTGSSGAYSIQQDGNGLYFFVIEGAITIAGERLSKRDGIGISDANLADFSEAESCQLLAMEVPFRKTGS